MYELWFKPYTKQHNDSSGFEHVFMGEEEWRVLVHNWLRLYMEEKAGRLAIDIKPGLAPGANVRTARR